MVCSRLTGLVPEGLPLSGEVTVTLGQTLDRILLARDVDRISYSGDTKQDAIVLLEGLWVVEGGNGGVLLGSVHLGQDLWAQSCFEHR